jgi:hypothetical protein
MAEASAREGSLVDEARAMLGAEYVDPAEGLALCARLIEAAERRAPDEPPVADGLAALAAKLARRCVDASDAHADPRTHRAYAHMALANAARLCRDWDAARAAFVTALDAVPDRGWWWFNLGLLHKARGEWREALAVNERARNLLGDERAVLWNLAIAATALGDGSRAAGALRILGHDARVTESGMPLVEGLSPVQVRAATIGSGVVDATRPPDAAPGISDRSVGFELLWVAPLSPVHGVVSSASWREASIDYGDLILWDGVPVGVGEHEGRPVPRFPLLAILRRGEERRFRFLARERDAGALARFERTLPADVRLFPHRARIESLCTQCAQAAIGGNAVGSHVHVAGPAQRLVQGKICVPGDLDLVAFRRDLDAIAAGLDGLVCIVPGLLEAIGDTVAAGKAHRMWLGLERSAAPDAWT